MSANDVSTAETAQSDQFYQPHLKQPQQCFRHHQHYQTSQQQQHQQQQQHSNHISSVNTPANWLHQKQQQQQQQQQQQEQQQHQLQQDNMEPTLRHVDDYYLCQQHATKSNNHQCNNVSAIAAAAAAAAATTTAGQRTFITPIDIPPAPPHPTTTTLPNAGSTNNINKRVQLQFQQQMQQPQPQQQQQLQYNSLGRAQQRQCQCKHPIEYVKQAGTQTALPTPPGPTTTSITPTTGLLQSPHPKRNSLVFHDFYETRLTPPPPPLGNVPAQQQQYQQQQQHKYPHTHTHTHTHTHAHQHYMQHRSQDHLQHLLPIKMASSSSKCSAASSATATSISSGFDVDGPRFKNLVYSQNKIRRIRWILGTLLAIVCLAGIGVAIYFIARSSDEGGDDPKPSGHGIYLDEFLDGDLTFKRFNASWSTGPNIIYKDGLQILEYDVKAKQKRSLLLDTEQQYALFEKSADGLYLLLAKKYKKNFRHSFEAEYDIYDISTKRILPLLLRGEQRFILMAQWAPVGNGLILNYDRNLYYKPSAFADEIAITNDDTPGILNGVPDWVYEEEVFSSNTATWFNSDGTMIAFIRFDDTPTNVMSFAYYGEAGDLRYQYPYSRLVAYPKAGSSNPHVKLFTANLTRAAEGLDALTEIPRPSELNTETDDVITVVHWLDKQKVLYVWMNRIQNLAYLQVFDGIKRTEIYNIESKTGWVDLLDAPFHNRDGSRIALILPQMQDDDIPYAHLCTLSTQATPDRTNQPEFLTKGKYVVQSILYWDAISDVIFYTANTQQQPEVLHIYATKASSGQGQTPTCLTCKLHIINGVEQNYYSASFNSDHQVIISSMGPGVPMHVAYEWSYGGNTVTLKELYKWETNHWLREELKKIDMPSKEIHTVPIDGGFTAKVQLQLPPNMDRSGKTKYPLLVEVYGGPNSYSVVNKWILDWGTYLSSNQSVIYAKIDGRGSGLRGDRLLHSVYLKLGTVEIADQINVTRYLQQKFDFIDSKHTGIWGWSYGGYAAAMALANDNNSVFNCAASIAPVTDWAYYDSIYTERYMSLPKYNEIGYANGRLSTRAHKLRDKKFLLVHGTLDDNVHYQQSMILAKSLERYDILFKQISYPDEDHSLAGVRPHLYHSLDRFFGECFAKKSLMGSK